MNQVDLRPEYRENLNELTAQKDLFLSLVLKLEELKNTVKPNLEAMYAVN